MQSRMYQCVARVYEEATSEDIFTKAYTPHIAHATWVVLQPKWVGNSMQDITRVFHVSKVVGVVCKKSAASCLEHFSVRLFIISIILSSYHSQMNPKLGLVTQVSPSEYA